MKNVTRILALVGYFALASIPLNAAAVVVIDFGTGSAGPGGTIINDGVNTTGTGILIGSMIVEGTAADSTYAVNANLNFDTGADTITVFGSIAGLGIFGKTLLSGSFDSFDYTAVPAPGGTTTEIFSGQGPDIKNSELLTNLGVPTNTPFEFFGFTIESANGNVVSTDIINTQAVPVPAAVWLFGSGLLGMVGIARRRRS